MPIRQAYDPVRREQEREWERWERQRRRELLAEYAKMIASVCFVVGTVVLGIVLLIGLANEAVR